MLTAHINDETITGFEKKVFQKGKVCKKLQLI
jgi:hypothetical protein